MPFARGGRRLREEARCRRTAPLVERRRNIGREGWEKSGKEEAN